MRIFVAILVALAAGCSSVKFVEQPGRPIRPATPGHELVRECEVSVRFNEDESSVSEDEYPDSYICLGMMEGILNTSSVIGAARPDAEPFCLPESGIKNWHAAKVLVEFAKRHPDKLGMNGVQLTILALSERYPCNR